MVGLFIAGIVGIVIIGGIKSIASVAGRLVPAMAGIYMLACFAVFATHFDAIPAAFVTIVTSALSPQAGMGAFIGALLMGVQRACFSNEAGMGSAAIAHSAAQTDDPVKQGMVGMLGPFIDTILICLMTALVITVTGVYGDADGSIQGVELTSQAFAQGASWFPYVLFVVVFLFAYSTLISWSYYGVKGFTFIFGENALAETIYRLIFCGFIVIGASADLSSVILFTDASFFAMAIPNIIGLYMLAPELKRDVKAYAAKLKAG
jgi:AGCS family alanine or glycine:cation symporter